MSDKVKKVRVQRHISAASMQECDALSLNSNTPYATHHSLLIVLAEHDDLVVDLLHALDRSNRSVDLSLERFALHSSNQRHFPVQHSGSYAQARKRWIVANPLIDCSLHCAIV